MKEKAINSPSTSIFENLALMRVPKSYINYSWPSSLAASFLWLFAALLRTTRRARSLILTSSVDCEQSLRSSPLGWSRERGKRERGNRAKRAKGEGKLGRSPSSSRLSPVSLSANSLSPVLPSLDLTDWRGTARSLLRQRHFIDCVVRFFSMYAHSWRSRVLPTNIHDMWLQRPWCWVKVRVMSR